MNTDFDNIILLDDDSELVISGNGVDIYLAEIENNPNKIGLFNANFFRLVSIPKQCFSNLTFEYVINLKPENGDFWEDFCYIQTFKKLWPDKVYRHSKENLNEVSLYSDKDKYSTWYRPEFKTMFTRSKSIIEK